MKKVVLFIVVFCAGLFVWAENKINFHLSFGFVETVNIADIDTIRFVDEVVMTEGEFSRNYSIGILDSITFTVEPMLADDDSNANEEEEENP